MWKKCAKHENMSEERLNRIFVKKCKKGMLSKSFLIYSEILMKILIRTKITYTNN
ncbi:hypothetical protein CLCAR_4218 [Clostridium carboxidivorans P7]|nr:hypothetical protein CLCAR_4218 [Clostridium carboxidivorans P7]